MGILQEKLEKHAMTIHGFAKLIEVSPSVLKKYDDNPDNVREKYRVKIETGVGVFEETGLVRPRLNDNYRRNLAYFGYGGDDHFKDIIQFEKEFKRVYRLKMEDLEVK
jgi:hypothetical protein